MTADTAVAATLTGVVVPDATVTPLRAPLARTPFTKFGYAPGTESTAATRTRYPVPGGAGIVTVPEVIAVPLMTCTSGFVRPPESTATK